MQKARSALRALRRGAAAFHPNVIYLHPALSFANNAGEPGRTIESEDAYPKGHVRRAIACSLAKTRARQDAERCLRDAGAPRGEISPRERRIGMWYVRKIFAARLYFFGQMEIISLTHRGKIDLSIAHDWRIEKPHLIHCQKTGSFPSGSWFVFPQSIRKTNI
jgi:hypothetical protein